MSTDFWIKKDDRLPAITATLEDANGPVDLTGATVKFHMRLPGGAELKVDAAATVVGEATGAVRYDWADGDTDTAGEYDAEWEVTDLSGKMITFPNWKHLKVMVRDDVD